MCPPQSRCTNRTEQIFSDSEDYRANECEPRTEVVHPHGLLETGTTIREQNNDAKGCCAFSDLILQNYETVDILLLLHNDHETKNLESIGHENNTSTPMRSSSRESHFDEDTRAHLNVEVVDLVQFERKQEHVLKDRCVVSMSKRPDIFGTSAAQKRNRKHESQKVLLEAELSTSDRWVRLAKTSLVPDIWVFKSPEALT